VGSPLEISAPKGDFTLVEQAAMSCFIAGGIGITPLIPMIERLVELGHPWQLHYAAASPARMPFRDRLLGLAQSGGQVFFHFSDGSTPRMEVDQVVCSLDSASTAHLYCCGPARMVDEFVAAARHRPMHTVHFERFGAAQPLATEGGYTVELASTGQRYAVSRGRTILEVLLDAGLEVPYSCGQGVCGACHTRVIAGEVDHRDCFLTEDERATNSAMLICCSGAKSGSLTLDL
jgi:vanillate O-demethylase ferredoxin subunit